jgi:hypothetical protein
MALALPHRGVLLTKVNELYADRDIQGLLTLVIGIASFILMPASPTQTASKFRGKNGWFNARYVNLS